jgi:dynein heavy chain
VIATLAAVKSKLIKKWRVTDVQLTEAFNTCKDKVWYLTMLQPHFDAIQQSLSPSMITNTILPSLTTTIKQMEGLSRLFARTNYIAVLLKKVSSYQPHTY